MKSVKMESGVSRREGERERESRLRERERQSICENGKQRGLRKVTIGKDT
jgi:hypothetical protein